MIKSLQQAVRRPISGMLLLCLVVLMFALAACGDTAPAASSGGSTGAAATTVTIKETKGASGGDVYMCDPTTLTVKTGDSVTFTNASDEVQAFTGGDAQKAGITLNLDLNASSTVKFATAGTYMLESTKKATITVTVQ